MLSSKSRRAQRALDKQLSSPRPVVPKSGWLKAIREAIGMSGQQYANRLNVAWQSMDDIEKSEKAGTISLNSLRKAAAALDCQLVYAVVPNASSLEIQVNQQARKIALAALERVNQTMLLEDQAGSPAELEHRIEEYIDDHIRDGDLWAK